MNKPFWLYWLVLVLLTLVATVTANAQQCTETGPCQQLACQNVSVYCSFCVHDTDCDPDGTTGMLDCFQTTTWTDWYFGTTCSSTTAEYCMYEPCSPFLTNPVSLDSLYEFFFPQTLVKLHQKVTGVHGYRGHGLAACRMSGRAVTIRGKGGKPWTVSGPSSQRSKRQNL